MNAFVKKEIRLLLPSFLIGIVLTFSNVLFTNPLPRHNNDELTFFIPVIICPAIALFMALNSFGAEISAGTFSMLLAQPVSRHKIWRTKTLLLAAALIVGGLFWSAIFYFRVMPFKTSNNAEDISTVITTAWLVLLAIYSGALWTVLLIRQVAAAFWFTILVPSIIAMIIFGFWPGKYADFSGSAISVGLFIYSLTGFWFARRLFLKAQDIAWTGGTISMPEISGLAWLKFSTSNRRHWRPRAALLMKEFQLHQSQFIMGGALLLLHLGVLATRYFGHYAINSDMEFILDTFWGLWLVMPILVGCAAAAEERKMGTLNAQLCLPVHPRTQFVIKTGVVILLSLLFGGVMPRLLEGTRILPGVHVPFNNVPFDNIPWHMLSAWQVLFWRCLEFIIFLGPLLALMGLAAAIGLISFYASTLSRNTLQALAPAVLGLLLACFLILTAQSEFAWNSFNVILPWNGYLIYVIGVPVTVVTLSALSYGNFKQTFIDGKVWRRNALRFLIMLGLVAITTTAVYHRAWERLTPFEPAHGTARLSLSDPVTLQNQNVPLSVRLPDGRIWTGNFSLMQGRQYLWTAFSDGSRMIQYDKSHYEPGSNWVNIVGTPWREQAGIKTDGTLWISAAPAHNRKDKNVTTVITQAGDLTRFGNETNWNSVAWTYLSLLLVKHDGTLWMLGVTNWNDTEHEWPGLRAFTPHQLGVESNWAKVFFPDQHYFEKTDGSLWTQWNYGQEHQIELEPGFSLGRMSPPQSTKLRATTTIRGGVNYNLGVYSDGTLRIWADQSFKEIKGTKNYQLLWSEADLRLGKETNWLGVAGTGQKIVTLKNDGTLWLWNFHHDDRFGWDTKRDEQKMLAVSPARLGIHSDWIAITSTDGGIISLAADGSLWFWPEQTYDGLLLKATRKPQFLANIFGKDN